MLLLAWFHVGCDKVPLQDVGASFPFAKAAWFAQEETLFLFYEAEAEQGISKESDIEVSFVTDDGKQKWVPVSQLKNVHTHEAVKCSPKGLCGSASPRVTKEPRNVTFRLRYHRDGETALEFTPEFHVMGSGPAFTNRSFLVYGVFDALNRRVQWRGRHQFPAVRNMKASELGLRREFQVSEESFGNLASDTEAQNNPYFYAFADLCPQTFASAGFPPAPLTLQRAVFSAGELPLQAAASAVVCAKSVIKDGRGPFAALAVARKNPDTRPAFDSLSSPITENTAVRFLVAPCNKVISDDHLEMQKQRLGITGAVDACTDDVSSEGLKNRLSALLGRRIDETRAQNKDMVLSIAFHHDDKSGAQAAALESALESVLPQEQEKSSPRVAGAFVFDSTVHRDVKASLKRQVLWCPAFFDPLLREPPDVSQQSCPVVPEFPGLKLGPFAFNVIPILPTRDNFLNFIKTYSKANAGSMTKMSFLSPTRTPLSENVAIGDFGQATFFNNERLTVGPEESLGFCPEENTAPHVVFKTDDEPFPAGIATLGEMHRLNPAPTYQLGLAWDFPFLLKLAYETRMAGAATALNATVPFGIKIDQGASYGAQAWTQGEFPLGKTLLLCTRFCTHPTFDSAGVYNVRAPWRDSYRRSCYRPQFPVGQPGEGAWPYDP